MKRKAYYPSWGPNVLEYSDQGSDKLQIAETHDMNEPFQNSYDSRDLGGFVEPMHNCKIGLDFDGVVTEFPVEISNIMNKVVKSGGRIFIITGRKTTDIEEVSSFLKQYKIPYENIHCYPEDYPAAHDDLLTKLSIGEWKGSVVNNLMLDMYADNDPIIIDKIKQTNPNLLIMYVLGKKSEPLSDDSMKAVFDVEVATVVE